MSLLDYNVIVDLGPVGGWKYPQPYQEGSVTIEAGDAEELVKQVRLFRVNARLDLGNVEEDIANYIKRVSPMNDRFPKLRKAPEKETREKFRPFIERAKDWLILVIPKRPVLLIEADAAVRAMICVSCQHNVKWKTGCGECNAEVEYRGQSLRQRTVFKHDGALGFCHLHNFYLPAGVFIESELPKKEPTAPTFCWLSQ